MKFQAIFWDNDGVLVDTEMLFFQATKTVFAQVGVEISLEYFIECSIRQGSSTFELLKEKKLNEQELEKMYRARNSLYSELLKTNNLIKEGVQEVLKSLHGKIVMGVVSNSLREHFDIIHLKSGLLPFFDFALTHEDFVKPKPDPAPYLLALERSGLNAEHCLVIEDNERGLTAAKAAGLTCFVIPNELSHTNNFSRADKILKDIKDLSKILKNH